MLLAAWLFLGSVTAQSGTVVAEETAIGEQGVVPLQVRLQGNRRYVLQVDGPPGVLFTAKYMQVFLNHNPGAGGSGNDDGSFDGAVPYSRDLLPPASGLLFWRYSAVVSPVDSGQLTVRVIDLGPQ